MPKTLSDQKQAPSPDGGAPAGAPVGTAAPSELLADLESYSLTIKALNAELMASRRETQVLNDHLALTRLKAKNAVFERDEVIRGLKRELLGATTENYVQIERAEDLQWQLDERRSTIEAELRDLKTAHQKELVDEYNARIALECESKARRVERDENLILREENKLLLARFTQIEVELQAAHLEQQSTREAMDAAVAALRDELLNERRDRASRETKVQTESPILAKVDLIPEGDIKVEVEFPEFAKATQDLTEAKQTLEGLRAEKEILELKLTREISTLSSEVLDLRSANRRSEEKHRAELNKLLSLNSLNPLREVLALTEHELRRLEGEFFEIPATHGRRTTIEKHLKVLREQKKWLTETLAEASECYR